MSEPKPCPFCGSEAGVDHDDDHYSVSCTNYYCKVECFTDFSVPTSYDDAIKAWNNRYEPTCTWKHTKSGPLYDVWVCCSCAYEYAESRTDRGVDNADFTYCPSCGARIVDWDSACTSKIPSADEVCLMSINAFIRNQEAKGRV